MQVATRAAHDARVAQMARLSAQVDALQAGIASGTRIAAPDDDPVGSARVLTIDRRLAATASVRGGIDRAASRLGTTDATLDGVSVVLQRAKEIALQGNGVAVNAADRATLAAEIAQLGQQLLGYANARDSDGGALFAGARTAAPAYAADATGAVAWQGAGAAAVLALDTGMIATGIDGPQLFDGLPGPTDAFAMLTALGTALTDPGPDTRAAGLATALTALDAAISRTADTRATVGTRLARLDAEAERLDAATTALRADRSTTADLDMTAAIARLQRLSTVLQATQLAFVKVANLSLWDQLR